MAVFGCLPHCQATKLVDPLLDAGRPGEKRKIMYFYLRVTTPTRAIKAGDRLPTGKRTTPTIYMKIGEIYSHPTEESHPRVPPGTQLPLDREVLSVNPTHPAAPTRPFHVINPSLNFGLIYRAISPPVTERHQMQMDAAKRMRFIAFDSLSLIATQKLTSTRRAFDIAKGILSWTFVTSMARAVGVGEYLTETNSLLSGMFCLRRQALCCSPACFLSALRAFAALPHVSSPPSEPPEV